MIFYRGGPNKKSPSQTLRRTSFALIVRGTTQIAHIVPLCGFKQTLCLYVAAHGELLLGKSLSFPDSEVIVYKSDVSASTNADSLGHLCDQHTSSSQSFYLWQNYNTHEKYCQVVMVNENMLCFMAVMV